MLTLISYDNFFQNNDTIKNDQIQHSSQRFDELSESKIISELAQEADLPMAIDAYVKSELTIAKNETDGVKNDETSVKSVPIFDLNEISRDIKIHKVKEGENINDLVGKYNILADTIKWANNLKTDNIKTGTNIKILPLDGILYKVKKGDTIDKIAGKYKANPQRIEIFNDLEISGLKEGKEIIIPEGVLPKKERPDYVAPVRIVRPVVNYYPYGRTYGNSGSFYNVYYNPYPNQGIGDNRAYYGQCTWWTNETLMRRGDNRVKGKRLGHAREYSRSLPQNGFKYSSLPIVGAVYQTPFGGGGYGHVGIVTAVKKDASGKITGFTISEMNAAGWNRVNSRDFKGTSGNFYY